MTGFSKEEKDILQDLKSGRWDGVEEKAFAINDQSERILFRNDVLKISKFWQKRIKLFSYSDIKSGSLLFAEWEHFVDFCCEYHVKSEESFFAVKSCIFKKIIDFLTKASKESGNSDREILVQLSYAFYEVEMIDRSMETLEFILGRFPDEDDFRVYTLIADIYGVIYPTEHPKHDLAIIMFNELFLKCIDSVDIQNIEYDDVLKLAELIRKDLFPENQIKYWIPVYGYLYGGLTVRRNLRYEEYKKLQDLISNYESEIRENQNLEILIPKLLNVYFWIFDYYVYQMHTLGGATQIFRRVLELFALLYQIPGYEESAKKLGLYAEKVLDILLQSSQHS